MNDYKVAGYRDGMHELHQWLKYCKRVAPIVYDEWYKLTVEFMNGVGESPYTDEPDALSFINEIEKTMGL